MENRFCKVYAIDSENQLLVIRQEGEDYSIIEECTLLKGTIVKNSIDFQGENHINESMEYLDGFTRGLAITQHASLIERVGGFLNPDA